MVIKKVCLEQNMSWLVQLHGIRSFHAPFHLFSQCFYIRVMSTKASNDSDFLPYCVVGTLNFGHKCQCQGMKGHLIYILVLLPSSHLVKLSLTNMLLQCSVSYSCVYIWTVKQIHYLLEKKNKLIPNFNFAWIVISSQMFIILVFERTYFPINQTWRSLAP